MTRMGSVHIMGQMSSRLSHCESHICPGNILVCHIYTNCDAGTHHGEGLIKIHHLIYILDIKYHGEFGDYISAVYVVP